MSETTNRAQIVRALDLMDWRLSEPPIITIEDTPSNATWAMLGFDSLDTIAFVMDVERHFNVELPDDELADCQTVGEFITLLESKLSLHWNHGQGADGPDDGDGCACTATSCQQACAAAGCGYCESSDRADPAPTPEEPRRE